MDAEEEQEEEVGTTHFTAPRFGDADSNAETVFEFYEHWKFFSSKK